MKIKMATVVALACALSACGGGGSSSNTASFQPLTQPAFIDTVPANTNAGMPTYQAQSDQMLAFTRINQIRTSAGLGVFRQNAQLDAAAQNHAHFNDVNNLIGHNESNTLPGYTGDNPAGQAFFANYPKYNTVCQVAIDGQQVTGTQFIDFLMSAIYHRMGMMEYGYDEVGIGISNGHTTMNMGQNPGQGAPNQDVITWPVANATSIPTNGDTQEIPNPMPGYSSYGYPVSVQTHEKKSLQVTAFTITKHSTQVAVTTKQLNYNTDSVLNQIYVAKFIAAAIPTAPLEATTLYDVHFSGSVDGKAITRDWSFTTQ